MRGVTITTSMSESAFSFQLTRLMRGVTWWLDFIGNNFNISTHTPHARRDTRFGIKLSFYCQFQLTRLMRGVTAMIREETALLRISTHTPHARRDYDPLGVIEYKNNFNSHASCEAWRCTWTFGNTCRNFNSHASCEAWHLSISYAWYFSTFQLTRLMRGVTCCPSGCRQNIYISTHTPHARRDSPSMPQIICCPGISTHTPHARRDLSLSAFTAT